MWSCLVLLFQLFFSLFMLEFVGAKLRKTHNFIFDLCCGQVRTNMGVGKQKKETDLFAYFFLVFYFDKIDRIIIIIISFHLVALYIHKTYNICFFSFLNSHTHTIQLNYCYLIPFFQVNCG